MSQIRTLVVTATRSGGISTVIVNRVSSANFASTIHGAASKATPVDADEIPLADSAASWVLKKLTWANLKATVKTYFDTIYATAAQGSLADSALQSVPTASDTVLGGVKVGSGLTITAGVLSVSGSSYTLPIATGSVLGGIKSSTDIIVDVDGVAMVNGVTDSTGSADAGKFIKLGAEGQFSINSGIAEGSVVAFTTSDAATAVTASSIGGLGAIVSSQDGVGARILTTDGACHAEFGSATAGDNRSFINRILGAFGWRRGAYKGLIQAAATLTDDRTWNLPDASGTLALTSDINAANIASVITGATEDTTPLDADQLPMTETAASGALRRLTFANLWTWIQSKLSAAFYRPLIVKRTSAIFSVTSSTTYVNVTGWTGYALEADTTYKLELAANITQSSAGGYKIQLLSSQALYTASGFFTGPSVIAGGSNGSMQYTSTTTVLLNNRTTTAYTAAPINSVLYFRTGAAAMVDIQFAQNASDATASSIMAGGIVSITKLL